MLHGTAGKTTTVYIVISFLYLNGDMFRSLVTIIRPSYRNFTYMQGQITFKNSVTIERFVLVIKNSLNQPNVLSYNQLNQLYVLSQVS